MRRILRGVVLSVHHMFALSRHKSAYFETSFEGRPFFSASLLTSFLYPPMAQPHHYRSATPDSSYAELCAVVLSGRPTFGHVTMQQQQYRWWWGVTSATAACPRSGHADVKVRFSESTIYLYTLRYKGSSAGFHNDANV